MRRMLLPAAMLLTGVLLATASSASAQVLQAAPSNLQAAPIGAIQPIELPASSAKTVERSSPKQTTDTNPLTGQVGAGGQTEQSSIPNRDPPQDPKQDPASSAPPQDVASSKPYEPPDIDHGSGVASSVVPRETPSASSKPARSSARSSAKASSVRAVSSAALSSKKPSQNASSVVTAPVVVETSSAIASSVASSEESSSSVAAATFTDRTTWGYTEPIINPDAVGYAPDFSASLINALIALLFALVFGLSGVVLRQLLRIDADRVKQILGRLPLQAFLALIIVWLLHLFIPTAAAQGIGGSPSPSLTWVLLYAFVFFVVIGMSNFIFNNIITSEGDKLHEFVVTHPFIARSFGEGRKLSTETWLIVLLIVLYGIVGAYINPSFNLLPSRQIGMALVTTLAIILSAYSKDFLRFILAKRWKLTAWFKANIGGLFFAIVCVIVSRELALSPGYIYGVPAGLFIVSAIYQEREGKFESLGIFWLMILTAAVWLLLPLLAPYQVLHDLGLLFFVILAEHAFIELLPLPYLAGGSIFAWKKLVWILQFAVVVFFLFQTLFNPKGTIVSLEQSPPGMVMLLLLGCYAVGVFLLWGYIIWQRNRKSRLSMSI